MHEDPAEDRSAAPANSPNPAWGDGGPTDPRPNAASGGASAGRQLVRGERPGSPYMRITGRRVQSLRWHGEEGLLEVGDAPPAAPDGAGGRAGPRGEPGPRGAATGRVADAAPVLPGLERRTIVTGHGPGQRYVRLATKMARNFRPRGEDTLEATEATLAPSSAVGRALDRARHVLIGRRLANEEEIHERLTKVKALAVLSSDAISSAAYATEASLGVLITVGLGLLAFNLPIAAAIIVLMVIVGFSYRQTIHAYPHGGGSYIVARDNLGDWPGLVAAAALMIDYVLTVSVSVAAGVDALTSAFQALSRYQVEIGLACIAIIMLGNLRGIRESGSIFAVPTYLFVVSFAVMILTGVVHAALAPGGLFHAVPPRLTPQQLHWESARLGIVLILTAFASGCVAMTGTEAISNGVPAFKKPEPDNAARTLVAMIAILATFYAGTTFLAWRFGIEPNPAQNPTVDSQIASLLFTGPFAWFYYVIQFATLLVLVLAANTSYADFPRLSSILARDHFLPHQFASRGNRLAFNTGILVLTVSSAVLLVVFRGSTDALINLYALGVFTAFTLSQSGMVVRWRRLRDQAGPGWRRSMIINLVGACATGLVGAVIIFTKFDRGAWIVVILVPVVVLLFRAIHRHYQHVRLELAIANPLPVEELAQATHIMVVPVAELNRPALRGLAYALSLTPNVIVVHVATVGAEEAEFRDAWKRWIPRAKERLTPTTRAAAPGATVARADPQLVVIESPYRSLIPPLVAYIDALRDANPQAAISVILPEFVPAHPWERLLHGQTAFRLKLRLYADPGVAVVNLPYRIAHD